MRLKSSQGGAPAARETVRVFTVMPELLRGVPPTVSSRLARVGVPLVRLPAGRWVAPQACSDCHFGFLVTDGVLVRRLTVAGRTGAELLGSGDLIRPWDRQLPIDTVATAAAWQVLEPAALAVLDSRFAHCVGLFPQVAATLLERSTERARMLAFQQVASHVPGLEGRLTAILWAMADRWGRVTPEGVLVPIRLTHATLAELVGASRPSVSSALKFLEREGAIDRREEGWLLYGDPPRTLEDRPRATGPAHVGAVAGAV